MIVPKNTTISETIAILFEVLFLYTGISKIMDYSLFKEQIATSPLLAPISPYIAGLLPLAEFCAAILLIIPRWRLKGFYASLVLMVLFTGYIIAMLTLNTNVPCSCGGVIELLSWNEHIVFNGAFIGLALVGITLQSQITYKKNKNLTPIAHPDLK